PTAVGRPLTTILNAQASGGSWSIAGPPRLVPGLYTAVATQHDDAGHTGRSGPRTFRLVPVPHVIGALVTLNRARLASIRIGCTAVSGSCTGDVLVLTAGRFQPVPGGPTGRLRVLFVYVSIRAGQTMLVRRAVASVVARVLRRN